MTHPHGKTLKQQQKIQTDIDADTASNLLWHHSFQGHLPESHHHFQSLVSLPEIFYAYPSLGIYFKNTGTHVFFSS